MRKSSRLHEDDRSKDYHAQPSSLNNVKTADKDKKRKGFRFYHFLFIIGFLLCFVPLLTNIMFQLNTAQSATGYSEVSSAIDDETKSEILAQARAYNARLGGYDDDTGIESDDILPYDEQLNIDGDGAIGWIEIPRAGIKATIYHGVGNDVLSMGVGHQSETSLPIGGTRSHCYLSGHSGMAQYQIFDNIRVLEAGDVIGIHVLDDVYAYRVVDWEIIDPDDVPDEYNDGDYITLVTCTTTPDPINAKGRTGINDKRLLVNAVRCDYNPDEFASTQTAVGVYVNDFTAPGIIGGAVLAFIIVLFIIAKIRRNHKNKNDDSAKANID